MQFITVSFEHLVWSNHDFNIEIAGREIATRVAAYQPPDNGVRTGVLAKYAKLVGSADHGAITG